jgi:hypothetical protein
MHGNSMRENREALSTPDTKLWSGRLEKAMSQKSNMHVVRESDSRGVPTKCLSRYEAVSVRCECEETHL